ncbi:hypothetical protein Bbelb_376090 [Branchiostoma belcheri]|nr:hypothetical protein Bbelb_376090 [Branchiostoma belcheri]
MVDSCQSLAPRLLQGFIIGRPSAIDGCFKAALDSCYSLAPRRLHGQFLGSRALMRVPSANLAPRLLQDQKSAHEARSIPGGLSALVSGARFAPSGGTAGNRGIVFHGAGDVRGQRLTAGSIETIRRPSDTRSRHILSRQIKTSKPAGETGGVGEGNVNRDDLIAFTRLREAAVESRDWPNRERPCRGSWSV